MPNIVSLSAHDTTPFLIRPARAADREAVLAFCARTFEWGDYVPLVWDEWLADEQGPLLVATFNDELVGVAKVSLLTPTEAWLQGLRVHEQYRRRGLAWQFLLHCLDAARQRGAQVARLATGSKNVAVHKTAARAGMRRVASVIPLEAQALASSEGFASLTRLGSDDWPQVSVRILNSAALVEMGGLYGAGWVWHRLTPDKLRTHLEHGQVLVLRQSSGEIVATAILSDVDQKWKALEVAYADGSEHHVQMLAHALQQCAASLQLQKVEVMIPAASSLRQAFVQAGYTPEMEADAEIWVYELELKGAIV